MLRQCNLVLLEPRCLFLKQNFVEMMRWLQFTEDNAIQRLAMGVKLTY